MQGRPAPPQPYIMLTVATSLTACTKCAVELGQQPGHQLGALGGRGDGVAEEVAAAGQQRADGRGVGALQDERLPLRQRQPLGGDVDRLGPRPGRRVLVGDPQAVGLGAGVDAEAAAVALVEVERDRHQPGQRVDLLPGHDAAVRRRRRRSGCSPCSTPARVPASAASTTFAIDDLLARPGRPARHGRRGILAPDFTDGERSVGGPWRSSAAAEAPSRRLRHGGWVTPERTPAGSVPASPPPPGAASPRCGRSRGAARRAGTGSRARPRRRARAPPPCCRAARPPAASEASGSASPSRPLPPASRRAAPPWMTTPTSRAPTASAAASHCPAGQRRQRHQQRAQSGQRQRQRRQHRQPGPVLGPGEGVLHQSEHRGPEAVLPAHRDQPAAGDRPLRHAAAAQHQAELHVVHHLEPQPLVAADPLPVGAAHQVEGADADEGGAAAPPRAGGPGRRARRRRRSR